MTTDSNSSSGFTSKEMWVRVDGKLDAVLSKQNHYDVELALIKARIEEAERGLRSASTNTETWHDEVRQEIATVREEQQTISARQKATAYIVAAVVTLSTIITPIILYIIGPVGG